MDLCRTGRGGARRRKPRLILQLHIPSDCNFGLTISLVSSIGDSRTEAKFDGLRAPSALKSIICNCSTKRVEGRTFEFSFPLPGRAQGKKDRSKVAHPGKADDRQPANWKEARRLRAWELVQQGWKRTAVAEALGVTRGAVSRWVSQARQGGPAALRHRKPIGAPRRLGHQQRVQLLELLARGPAVFGFSGDILTRRRVAQVIQREFGVPYDPSQVGRILKGCGCSDASVLQGDVWRDLKRESIPLRVRDERRRNHRRFRRLVSRVTKECELGVC